MKFMEAVEAKERGKRISHTGYEAIMKEDRLVWRHNNSIVPYTIKLGGTDEGWEIIEEKKPLSDKSYLNSSGEGRKLDAYDDITYYSEGDVKEALIDIMRAMEVVFKPTMTEEQSMDIWGRVKRIAGSKFL